MCHRMLPCLVVLFSLGRSAATGGEEGLTRFAQDVLEGAGGRPVAARELEAAETERLRTLTRDPQAPLLERAVALALLGRSSPAPVREVADGLIERTRQPLPGRPSRAGPPPIESRLHWTLREEGQALSAEHVPWLALLA